MFVIENLNHIHKLGIPVAFEHYLNASTHSLNDAIEYLDDLSKAGKEILDIDPFNSGKGPVILEFPNVIQLGKVQVYGSCTRKFDAFGNEWQFDGNKYIII